MKSPASSPACPAQERLAPAITSQNNESPERISKVLARRGVASRRDVERMIADGRVCVDGTILDSPAQCVTNENVITVDGHPVHMAEGPRVWLFHKPKGCLTTHKDPEGRPTLFELLPKNLPRVISVGRLDFNTEGLLLLTNDGDLAHTLEKPNDGLPRTYRVRIFGKVTAENLEQLAQGITVDETHYRPISVVVEHESPSHTWLAMTLTEGKNREIHRVSEALGWQVTRLIRVSYGPFVLGTLASETVQEIRRSDVQALLARLESGEDVMSLNPQPIIRETRSAPGSLRASDTEIRQDSAYAEQRSSRAEGRNSFQRTRPRTDSYRDQTGPRTRRHENRNDSEERMSFGDRPRRQGRDGFSSSRPWSRAPFSSSSEKTTERSADRFSRGRSGPFDADRPRQGSRFPDREETSRRDSPRMGVGRDNFRGGPRPDSRGGFQRMKPREEGHAQDFAPRARHHENRNDTGSARFPVRDRMRSDRRDDNGYGKRDDNRYGKRDDNNRFEGRRQDPRDNKRGNGFDRKPYGQKRDGDGYRSREGGGARQGFGERQGQGFGARQGGERQGFGARDSQDRRPFDKARYPSEDRRDSAFGSRSEGRNTRSSFSDRPRSRQDGDKPWGGSSSFGARQRSPQERRTAEPGQGRPPFQERRFRDGDAFKDSSQKPSQGFGPRFSKGPKDGFRPPRFGKGPVRDGFKSDAKNAFGPRRSSRPRTEK